MTNYPLSSLADDFDVLTGWEAAQKAAQYAVDALTPEEWESDPQANAESHLELLAEAGAKFPMAEDADSINSILLDRFASEEDSRDTSREILEAITAMAKDYREAVRIWGNPYPDEVKEIAEWFDDPSEYQWGEAGSYWFE